LELIILHGREKKKLREKRIYARALILPSNARSVLFRISVNPGGDPDKPGNQAESNSRKAGHEGKAAAFGKTGKASTLRYLGLRPSPQEKKISDPGLF